MTQYAILKWAQAYFKRASLFKWFATPTCIVYDCIIVFYDLKNHTRKAFQKDQIILDLMAQLEICFCVCEFSWKTILVVKLFEDIQFFMCVCVCVFVYVSFLGKLYRLFEDIQLCMFVCVCEFSWKTIRVVKLFEDIQLCMCVCVCGCVCVCVCSFLNIYTVCENN